MLAGLLFVVIVLLVMTVIGLLLRLDTIKGKATVTEADLENSKRDLETANTEIVRLNKLADAQSDVIADVNNTLDVVMKLSTPMAVYEEGPLTPAEGSPIFAVNGGGDFTLVEPATAPFVKKKRRRNRNKPATTSTAPKPKPKPKKK